jgi:hypothetical protein
MGTANRDASQVTVKKRNQAENAYYNDWKNVTVLAGGSTNMAVTRPTGAGAQVIAEIKGGCVACYAATGVDVNQNPIPNYSSGGAGARM